MEDHTNDPEPLMPLATWFFMLEQYLLACQNDRRLVVPDVVLQWIEDVRDDHPDTWD